MNEWMKKQMKEKKEKISSHSFSMTSLAQYNRKKFFWQKTPNTHLCCINKIVSLAIYSFMWFSMRFFASIRYFMHILTLRLCARLAGSMRDITHNIYLVKYTLILDFQLNNKRKQKRTHTQILLSECAQNKEK